MPRMIEVICEQYTLMPHRATWCEHHLISCIPDLVNGPGGTLVRPLNPNGPSQSEIIVSYPATTIEYDNAGRRFRSTQIRDEAIAPVVTRTIYNELGLVKEVIDPNNNKTEYTYDLADRVKTQTTTGTRTYTYDAFGNVIQSIDREGTSHPKSI